MTRPATPRECAALLAALPHRDPFRFVSELRSCDEHCATGAWIVHGTEPFFAGHFPGAPVVPGVLISEALAQLAGLLLARAAAPSVGEGALAAGELALVDVRFRRAIAPPAEIALEARLETRHGGLGLCAVTATCAGAVVAEGRVVIRLAAPTELPGEQPSDPDGRFQARDH